MEREEVSKYVEFLTQFGGIMRDNSLSDSEIASTFSECFEKCPTPIRNLMWQALSKKRPCLFERLATVWLQRVGSQNIDSYLRDLKNEEVSNEQFYELWLKHCDLESGEFRDNKEIVSILSCLANIFRPNLRIERCVEKTATVQTATPWKRTG